MSDTLTKTDVKTRISPPSMWKVIFHNDDVTPMDFVASLLVQIFHKSVEEAAKITLEVHVKGRAVVGVYTKEIANTKVELTLNTAKSYNYPLLATAEKT